MWLNGTVMRDVGARPDVNGSQEQHAVQMNMNTGLVGPRKRMSGEVALPRCKA